MRTLFRSWRRQVQEQYSLSEEEWAPLVCVRRGCTARTDLWPPGGRYPRVPDDIITGDISLQHSRTDFILFKKLLSRMVIDQHAAPFWSIRGYNPGRHYPKLSEADFILKTSTFIYNLMKTYSHLGLASWEAYNVCNFRKSHDIERSKLSHFRHTESILQTS